MQCSNTWTMDTSHDCKSNTKSIILIIYIKTGVLLEGLGEQVGFQLWLKWVCLCVADWEKQIIPSYRSLIGERSLSLIGERAFLFEQRDLQFTSAVDRKVRDECWFVGQRGIVGWSRWRSCNACRMVCILCGQRLIISVVLWGVV